jgi:ribonuclease E
MREYPMTKKILINAATEDEIRVAVVKDGGLQEIGVEMTGRGQISGNIYKCIVTRLDPRLNAAFVDYGNTRNGFLPASDVHSGLYKTKDRKATHEVPSIRSILERNQQILVQVSQDPRGAKGALLTTMISLPGRYLVLMPYQSKNGVSRKIEEERERERLKKIIDEINASEEFGFIVRTAGKHRNKRELAREARSLKKIWQSIDRKAKKATPPALIYQETNLAIRTIRDYLSHDVEEIFVDSPDLYAEIQDFFKATMPRYKKILKLYKGASPLLNKYQIEDQIESIYDHKVRLKSGGTIVIDSTEAFVAIDINTGKTSIGEDPETTAFQTNLEAAHEIARQLRLRDLGGLIVIDFIDMEVKKHRSEVEKALKEAFKGDKARVRFSRISYFGLLEMSRQRLRPTLESRSYDFCPLCKGSGTVKSAEAQGLQIFRRIQAASSKKNLVRVEGEVPANTARYLLNEMRAELTSLEQHFQIKIDLRVNPSPVSQEAHLKFMRASKKEDGYSEEDVHF